jgi:peptidoglycan hydrolase CwlO-like protein
MRKTLIKVLLICIMISVSSCSGTPVKPTTPSNTITMSQQEFNDLKDNVTKLGQDAKFWRDRALNCEKSKQ